MQIQAQTECRGPLYCGFRQQPARTVAGLRACREAAHHLLPGSVMTLATFAGRGAIKMHGGFYNGAKRHLAEIATVVRACDERAGRRLPVWVTGHSLGGGYANALALHLLAQQNTAELFGAGALLPDFAVPRGSASPGIATGICQPWLSLLGSAWILLELLLS